jgi:arylsulfatase A-like enzyme
VLARFDRSIDASARELIMPGGKPNILVIWGDDIGISNLSCYSDGMMGYRTPNIDRIANEGMRFTDSSGEQSCTAGRAAFTSGQSVYRTGMSKVGAPTAMASAFLDTFKEFPPRHPPASFSIDQIVKKLNDFLAAD